MSMNERPAYRSVKLIFVFLIISLTLTSPSYALNPSPGASSNGQIEDRVNWRLEYLPRPTFPSLSPPQTDQLGEKCLDCFRVCINGDRYDWLIRKPGEYVPEPIDIELESSWRVEISFSGFGDLKAVPPASGAIPVSYGFGSSLERVNRWYNAEQLNDQKLSNRGHLGKIVKWRLWHKIKVNEGTKAGDYQESGIILFTVSGTCSYICGE